jgi:hypothetical protein
VKDDISRESRLSQRRFFIAFYGKLFDQFPSHSIVVCFMICYVSSLYVNHIMLIVSSYAALTLHFFVEIL